MQVDLAALRARLSPERPAVCFQGRWYRYADLEQRACRLAAALRAAGVGRGDRVGILAPNHLAHIDLMLAAPKLGFIATPFNYRLSGGEQAQLAAYVEPALMLHEASLPPPAGVPGLDLDDYEGWLAAAPDWAAGAPAVSAEDTAMILFTGGSTGLPKGAEISYRQQFYNGVNSIQGWGLRDDDCAIQATPAFHAAINALTMPLLQLGARVVLPRAFDPGEYLRQVREQRVSILFMVPTMYRMLTTDPGFAATDFSSVRWAISGGAPCPAPVREPFRKAGVRFRQGYGMTEAGVNCFAIELAQAERKPDAVGVPMPHAQAVIRHPDGRPVAQGESGELTLAGPHLFSGYFRRPEATAEALRDGWLWTGDLARQDEEGLFYISGRRKEMFIAGGENVYPVEIENALYALPEVAECAVLGVPDAQWGEIGLAAVVLQPGQALDGEALRARLRGRLAGYKLPRAWLLLDELPKSGAGKILKPALRAQWLAQSAATA